MTIAFIVAAYVVAVVAAFCRFGHWMKGTQPKGSQAMKLGDLTADSAPVELGERYRDSLLGIEGVATSRHIYITGCDRIVLEYVHDGEVKVHTVDAPLLVAVATAAPVRENRRPGGPREMPASRPIG